MSDKAHSAHVDEARRKAFQSVGRASMFTEQSRVLFFKKKDEEVQKASLWILLLGMCCGAHVTYDPSAQPSGVSSTNKGISANNPADRCETASKNRWMVLWMVLWMVFFLFYTSWNIKLCCVVWWKKHARATRLPWIWRWPWPFIVIQLPSPITTKSIDVRRSIVIRTQSASRRFEDESIRTWRSRRTNICRLEGRNFGKVLLTCNSWLLWGNITRFLGSSHS